jgi:putative ABC transport system permease protein
VSLRFAARMARRDARAGLGTLAVCGGAIALGVAALVAVGSFRASVEQAIARQGRDMLGADAILSSRRPFPDSVLSLLDSLAGAGTSVARATGFPSMVLAPRSGSVQLLEVRAIQGGWPFYGTLVTEPAGAWAALASSDSAAILDPEAAAQLSVSAGDTVTVGRARFVVAGVATDLPGRSATGVFNRPRVYIGARSLGATGLLQRGSLVTYRAYLASGGPGPIAAFLERHRQLLRRSGVRSTTPAREQDRLTRGVGYGTRFLGLVGLAALLLGGLGVASGARVLASSRLRSAALLRCLGASRGSVLSVYLLETLALAALASAAGATGGVAVQAWLARLLESLLPVAVPFGAHPVVVAAGFGVGVASALLFALLPLLDVRDVTPLAALRRAEGGLAAEPRRRDLWRWGAGALLVAGVTALCLWEAPNILTGAAFAAGLALLAGILAALGRGLSMAARRLLPRRAPYAVRQGVSNLFRPRNQTLAVVVALGLGAFLVGTLVSVQSNLLRRLRLVTGPDRPDLVLFDIQPDQKAGVLQLLRSGGHPELGVTPISVLRIAALNGVDAARLRAGNGGEAGPDSSVGSGGGTEGGRGPNGDGSRRRGRPEAWALGREYRSTWRDTLTRTETLVAGKWWDSAWSRKGTPAQLSLSTDIARDLGVAPGDTITWQAAGRRIATVVSSLRDVDWAQPALNFFAVFQPGSLEGVPATWVVLTRIPDPQVRAAFQRALVERYPAVAAVDLARIETAIREAVVTVAGASRFMTLFSVAAGLLILVAAIGTSRRQRLRESVLLRTLGARSATLRTIHLTEYACLGGLAGLAGVGLAAVAAWGLVGRLFGLPYRVPTVALGLFWLATIIAAVGIGAASGARTLRRPPLEVLRELEE